LNLLVLLAPILKLALHVAIVLSLLFQLALTLLNLFLELVELIVLDNHFLVEFTAFLFPLLIDFSDLELFVFIGPLSEPPELSALLVLLPQEPLSCQAVQGKTTHKKPAAKKQLMREQVKQVYDYSH